MKTKRTDGITRREFGRSAALVVVGTVGAGMLARRGAAEEPLVTEVEAAAPVVASLGYVNESKTEGQQCSNCMLYTGPAEGRGKCGVFPQGAVAAKGWCKSWAPKPQ